MRILRVAGALVGAVVVALSGAGAAYAAEQGTGPSTRAPIPVTYHFLSGAALALGEPGATLPGANDWSCTPGADKPRPVVLVHGTLGGGTTNWATYGPLLHNEGYCVYTLTYGAMPGASWPLSELGAVSDIRAVSAPQVARFVDRVLEATGAEQVDLVGHSQGTLVSGLVAKHERPGRVHTVASISPLWHGTDGSLVDQALTGSTRGDRAAMESAWVPVTQMMPGSLLLQELWEGGTPYAPGVHYLNVATRYDEAVLPHTSGLVAGPLTTNVVVQDGCEQNLSEHVAVAADPRAADYVLNALDPEHPREPRCVAIAPVHGPTGS
ncbi:esterase/lipase family protein [Dietzia aurantiaca]|uniref:Esterase/lipase family protein n=1 Tax=Dietzia aurantiaca TaxID=983873 RepID=A0ABV9PVB6_9ACTN